MSAVYAFTQANTYFHEREWDTLYILLDIHGTIMVPNWDGVSHEFYPHCLDVLRHLSDDDKYKIIMWTCSKEDDRNHYKKILEEEGVKIDYINENPEVEGKLDWGDYSSKLYCNVLLDDKAGFSATEEWVELKKYFGIYDYYTEKLDKYSLEFVVPLSDFEEAGNSSDGWTRDQHLQNWLNHEDLVFPVKNGMRHEKSVRCIEDIPDDADSLYTLTK